MARLTVSFLRMADKCLQRKSKKGIIIAAVAAFVALAVALGVFVIPSLFVGSPKDQLKRMGMDSIKTMTTALEKSGEQLDTGVTSNAKVTPGEGLLAILVGIQPFLGCFNKCKSKRFQGRYIGRHSSQ